jgi:hypothetical protein
MNFFYSNWLALPPRGHGRRRPRGGGCLHFALQGRMNQMHDPARVKQLSGEHERVIGRARPFPVKSFSLFLGNYNPPVLGSSIG